MESFPPIHLKPTYYYLSVLLDLLLMDMSVEQYNERKYGIGSFAPTKQVFPSGQGVQADDGHPSSLANQPSLQGQQSYLVIAAGPIPYVPAGQGKH